MGRFPPNFTKSKKRLSALWVGSLFLCLSTASNARAWYDHTALMPWIIETIEADFRKFPNHPYTELLEHPLPPRDSFITIGEYQEIAEVLLFNLQGNIPSATARDIRELLRLAPDDPDQGMDKGLPDSADPQNDRQWMGGNSGTTSQGFRHMYFGGWRWTAPIATFQIPTHAVGQAMDRFDLLANEARVRIRAGDTIWGLRILGWSLHYLQDLTQPFHTNQVPSFVMLPLESLLQWPPARIWPHFKAETQRTLENYHWAYEGYVRELLLEGDRSPLNFCLREKSSTLLVGSPRELIEDIVRSSRKRSPEMARAVADFFGSDLKRPEYALARGKGKLDFAAFQEDPTKKEARDRVHAVTCESLTLAKAGSLWMLKWAFAK